MLNCIYEEEFLGFSYGFRPKRGQHDALDALVVGITTRRVNFIFSADVASFFDSVSKNWLVRFVEHRIGDKRIIRLIRKWLKAGVLEDGVVTVSEIGTGQGSVISPLLANIYTPTPARIRRPPLPNGAMPDSAERMIRPGFLDIESRDKPDRVGSGRVGRSSSGPTCERAGVARRWDELRGDCEGPVAGRRHHPHLVSPV